MATQQPTYPGQDGKDIVRVGLIGGDPGFRNYGVDVQAIAFNRSTMAQKAKIKPRIPSGEYQLKDEDVATSYNIGHGAYGATWEGQVWQVWQPSQRRVHGVSFKLYAEGATLPLVNWSADSEVAANYMAGIIGIFPQLSYDKGLVYGIDDTNTVRIAATSSPAPALPGPHASTQVFVEGAPGDRTDIGRILHITGGRNAGYYRITGLPHGTKVADGVGGFYDSVAEVEYVGSLYQVSFEAETPGTYFRGFVYQTRTAGDTNYHWADGLLLETVEGKAGSFYTATAGDLHGPSTSFRSFYGEAVRDTFDGIDCLKISNYSGNENSNNAGPAVGQSKHIRMLFKFSSPASIDNIYMPYSSFKIKVKVPANKYRGYPVLRFGLGQSMDAAATPRANDVCFIGEYVLQGNGSEWEDCIFDVIDPKEIENIFQFNYVVIEILFPPYMDCGGDVYIGPISAITEPSTVQLELRRLAGSIPSTINDGTRIYPDNANGHSDCETCEIRLKNGLHEYFVPDAIFGIEDEDNILDIDEYYAWVLKVPQKRRNLLRGTTTVYAVGSGLTSAPVNAVYGGGDAYRRNASGDTLSRWTRGSLYFQVFTNSEISLKNINIYAIISKTKLARDGSWWSLWDLMTKINEGSICEIGLQNVRLLGMDSDVKGSARDLISNIMNIQGMSVAYNLGIMSRPDETVAGTDSYDPTFTSVQGGLSDGRTAINQMLNKTADFAKILPYDLVLPETGMIDVAYMLTSMNRPQTYGDYDINRALTVFAKIEYLYKDQNSNRK